jgi:hypothetical protein
MDSKLRHIIVVVFFLIFFLFQARISFAEVEQNVLVNCFDYYIRPDAPEHAGEPAEPGQSGAPYRRAPYTNYNGTTHILMLKNRAGSLFSVGKPVYVMRNNTTGYLGNPAGHEAFCALDQANSPLCTTDMMQPNGIKTGEGFRIVDQTKPIMPDASGNVTLPHVRAYTPLWNTNQGDTSYFYGVQLLADIGPQEDTNAVGSALKLGTFTPTGTIPNTDKNCVTIYWDPAGKVIDAKTLEPVLQTRVTLYTIDENGQRSVAQEPGNPLFTNPYSTDAGGNFTFAVKPGSYSLDVVKTGFTFPVDTVTLQKAALQLSQIDPNRQYVDHTKLYNNTLEAIVETAGTTQYRYMVMSPTDPNYTGSTPAVLSALISLAPNGNQIIQGVVSHPKGVVKATVNGIVLAQIAADMRGEFTLEVPAAQMPPNPSDISITEEKVALVAMSLNPITLLSSLSRLWGTVYAQTETRISKPLLIKPIPATVTGFAYSQNYQVIPNATVNILVFGVPYSTGHADSGGFVSIPTSNLPPFDYTIEVKDTPSGTVVNQQTPAQFIATNKTYATAENINYFQPVLSATTQPQGTVLAQVQADAATKKNSGIEAPHVITQKSYLSDNTAPTTFPTNIPSTSTAFNTLLPFILLIGVLVIVAVVILVISKARSSNRGMV